MPRSRSHDLPSLVTGIITFIAGIGMLALVFSLAYHLFTQPVPGLNLSSPPKGVPPPAASIGVALSAFLVKLLLLAMLTIVGSLVASKGIHLVFAAAHTHGPDGSGHSEKNGTGALPAAALPETQLAPPPQ